jgi:hypothetical protein
VVVPATSGPARERTRPARSPGSVVDQIVERAERQADLPVVGSHLVPAGGEGNDLLDWYEDADLGRREVG